MEAFCLIVIVIAGLVIFTAVSSSDQKAKELAQLRAAYNEALQQLRKEPTNARYHERALDTGRAYANATRDKKGVTVFDETALANDIRAVTANASQVAPAAPVAQSTPTTPSIDERIAALQKLRAAGMLSDEEFEQKRKEILDSI